MQSFNNQDRSKKHLESDCGNYPDDWDEEIKYPNDIANSFSGKVKYYLAMGLFIFVIAGLLYVIFFM